MGWLRHATATRRHLFTLGIEIEIQKAIPYTAAKEWISLSYVRAIVAQAGLNARVMDWDDGIDLEVGSNKHSIKMGPHKIKINWVPLQVKSTTKWQYSNGRIEYKLKTTNYDKLREKGIFPSQYLVLYCLPDHRRKWVTHCPNAAHLHSKAYFIDLAGYAEAPLTRTGNRPEHVKISIPTNNTLNASAILHMYKNIAYTANEKLSSIHGGA